MRTVSRAHSHARQGGLLRALKCGCCPVRFDESSALPWQWLCPLAHISAKLRTWRLLACSERSVGYSYLSVLCLACTGAHTDAMNNLANLLRADGKLADAAELLVKAVQLAPTDVRYMLNLADTLMSLRRHADAAEYFERALALAPSVGAISAAVGRCYRHRKAHRTALRRQPFARMWPLHVRPCKR